nr:hypothetical protein [uncultured Empedobacter sp.]
MKIKSLLIILFPLLIFACSKNIKVNYSFIGQYNYTISDSVKFNQTVLTSNSFGYSIGDLEVEGLRITAPQILLDDKENQYIISMHSPIDNLKLNYGCDCYPEDYYPLEVIKSELSYKNMLFIYRINDKREFKHLLP